MKWSLLLAIIFILSVQTMKGQQVNDVYKYFDAAWKPVKEKKAVYLLRIRFTKDSCWQFSYYNIFGPLIRIEPYQDQKATMRHGLFAWYNEDGRLDSSGYYDHGMQDKDWIYPDAEGKIHKEQYFNKGKALTDKEFREKLKAEEIIDPAFPDFSRLSPESYFPGGQDGWNQYLATNLRYPNRAVDNMVKGTVLALFLVKPSGKLQDIRLLKSIELSLDDTATQMIENSPDWVPAIKLDHKVKSFKVQPIVFKLEVSNRG